MTEDERYLAAVAAHKAGDFETARRGYESFLPKLNAALNLAVLNQHQGDYALAEHILRQIVEQRPQHADARYSLSLCLLATRRYEEGWRLHDARRDRETIVDPDTSAPEWTGDEARGRRIVVCGEQGLGDQMQFARYVWALKARGAEVTYATDPRLRGLFEAAGLATAPFLLDYRTIPDCDAWVLVCSLPDRLGIAEPLPLHRFGPVHRGGGGVGVVPTGRPDHTNDAQPSLPPQAAARLLALGRDLRPEATGAKTFQETAELIAGLDLVVTVDTSVAHLAGSMGVPTWILLPAFAVDWRWGRGRSDTPWYPSVRLIRQARPNAWDEVIDRVEAELKARGPGAEGC